MENLNGKERSVHEHGPLYWLIVNLWKIVKEHYEKRKFTLFVCAFIMILFLFVFRNFIHPLVLFVRIYSFEIILAVITFWCVKRFKHRMGLKSWLALIIVCLTLTLTAFLSWTPHEYLSLYLRYRSLDKENLTELPETDHERIQPLNSIRVLANQIMTNNVQPTEPYNVRVDGEYRWTMGVGPSYFWSRLSGGVDEVINVSSTAPSPNFSSENRIPVSFKVGESLYLGKNTRVSTIRSFSLIRYLSYEPADVRFLKDDSGEWVQVVSLVKWEGFFFPQPKFGGVQVIHQSKGGALHLLKTVLIGDGDFIPAKDIGKHPFLVGQNIVPFKVSRNIAESFRFHEGFWAPFWGHHQGDLCIPDLPDDANDQPFTIYFKMNGDQGKLFQYFGLEPYQLDKRGLSLSVLVPADGIGKVFIHDHGRLNETMIGVSAVSAVVKSSKKTYDWSHNRATEYRPYVRRIDGINRLFWLATVETSGNKNAYETGDYVAGSSPEVVLTDPKYRVSVWVNSSHPEEWVNQLKEELRPFWKSN